MKVSEKLSAAIHEKNITIRELSDRTCIPKSAIQRYTSGETERIPIDRMKKMAEVLGEDPAYIMGWVDLSEAHRKLHDIAESLPTAKQSRGWQALSRGFSRAEGEPEEYTMSDIDYALSDEIQDLSETDKQEILDYIRFKRAQKAKKEQQP